MKTVLAYFGTHAEAIKVAPVAACLVGSSQVSVRVAAPHGHLTSPSAAAGLFGIRPEQTFPRNRKNRHSLRGFGQPLAKASQFLTSNSPDVIIVHVSGPESTALAIAAARLNIPLASLDTSAAAFAHKSWHRGQKPLCKKANLYLETSRTGYDRLLAEGVPEASIELTGSTTIDSQLRGISAAQAGHRPDTSPAPVRRLLTGSGTPILAILRGTKDDAKVAGLVNAMLDSAAVHPDQSYLISAPAAMGNFRWRRSAATRANLVMCGSLDFRSYCRLLARSKLVLADDSTVQAEAATLGKTVLPPGSKRSTSPISNSARDFNPIEIVREMELALHNPSPVAPGEDPFGDGLASLRCAAAVAKLLGLNGVSRAAGPAVASQNFINLVRADTELAS